MNDAPLLQQVADLTHLVEELQQLLRGQALMSARQGRGLAELTDRLDDLNPDLDPEAVIEDDGRADDLRGEGGVDGHADGEDDDAPPTPRPSAWVDYADARQWRELAAWVDWLHRTYDLRPNVGVPPCWPAHPGVAEELAALHAAWREAATEARPMVESKNGTLHPGPPADTSTLIHWHDRWLAPLLTRIRTLYQASNCQQGHTNVMDRQSTDTDLLAQALSWVQVPHDAAPAPVSELRCDLTTRKLDDSPSPRTRPC